MPAAIFSTALAQEDGHRDHLVVYLPGGGSATKEQINTQRDKLKAEFGDLADVQVFYPSGLHGLRRYTKKDINRIMFFLKTEAPHYAQENVHFIASSAGADALVEVYNRLPSIGRTKVGAVVVNQPAIFSRSKSNLLKRFARSKSRPKLTSAVEAKALMVFDAHSERLRNFFGGGDIPVEDPSKFRIRRYIRLVVPDSFGTIFRQHVDVLGRSEGMNSLAVLFAIKDSYNDFKLFDSTEKHYQREYDKLLKEKSPDTKRHFPFFPPGGGPGGGKSAFTSHFLTGNKAVLPSNLGGVDFSTLQLNYFTEVPGEQNRTLGYVFKAKKAERGVAPVVLEQAARSAFDAFFVWLALPNNTFWVNLNPNNPNRIIHHELGQTDAGRIMLLADLEMKSTVAKIIHPDNALGKAFWNRLYGYVEAKRKTKLSLLFRQWIVPGKVTVYTTHDSIYIVDAALEVKMESEYLELKGSEKSATPIRGNFDTDLQAYAEKLFRQMILPEVIKQVNTAPEYS